MNIDVEWLKWLMVILLMSILILVLVLPWSINVLDYKVSILQNRAQEIWKKKKFGLLAKEVVESYCPIDKYTTLKTSKDERGKFGRILGDFLVYDATTDSWKMLSEILINNHFAVAYHGQSKEEIKEAHFFNREKVRGLLKE